MVSAEFRVRANVNVTANSLATFCQRWKVTSLAVFGSALRDDFGPQSDIDLLVSFAKDAGWTLFDLVTMQDELELMFGRRVDLVEREAVEHSENYVRRHHILSHIETIYTSEYAPQMGQRKETRFLVTQGATIENKNRVSGCGGEDVRLL